MAAEVSGTCVNRGSLI